MRNLKPILLFEHDDVDLMTVAMQLLRRIYYGAAVIPLCSGSPYSLDLQIAPTAGHIPFQGSQALYTTHRPYGY